MRSKRSHESSLAEPAVATIEVLSESLPWEDPRVREDVRRMYNLRLPEPYPAQAQAYFRTHVEQHATVLPRRPPAGDR